MKESSLKNDKYRKNRGGYSRLLEISCQKCNKITCKYQKDGPGNLRRMYVDRILDSDIAVSKKELACSCGNILGMRVIYEKEKRPAFRLFVDAITKKIIKSR